MTSQPPLQAGMHTPWSHNTVMLAVRALLHTVSVRVAVGREGLFTVPAHKTPITPYLTLPPNKCRTICVHYSVTYFRLVNLRRRWGYWRVLPTESCHLGVTFALPIMSAIFDCIHLHHDADQETTFLVCDTADSNISALLKNNPQPCLRDFGIVNGYNS